MRLQMLVPLHTYPDGDDERLAQHVAAFAKHLEADVHAIVLVAEFPHVSSAFGRMLIDVPELIADAKAKGRARGGVLVKTLEAELSGAGIAFTKGEVACHPAVFGDEVSESARYNDLILVGLGSGPAARATAEAAIFGSGRPVVLVPEAAGPASGRHVLIAWDGSRVAARAVADAGAFLSRADAVTIATVTDEKALPENRPAERLSDYLSRRGVSADIVQAKCRGRSIADTLQQQASESGADLIVMGGYGHSRMRDFVLGGATAGILANLQVATLISH